MNKDVFKILENFIYLKLNGKLKARDLEMIYEQAENYADSINDSWPDHLITMHMEQLVESYKDKEKVA